MSTRFGGVICSLALLMPGAALAQDDGDTGLYVSLSANWLDANFSDVEDVDFSEDDTTWGLRIGSMFTETFGVEGGYIDLGSYNASEGFETNADAWLVAAILNYEISEQFSMFAKGGFAYVDARSDQANLPGAEDDETFEPFLGLGAEWDLSNTVSLFGEYSWVDTDVSDLTVDILTFGIKYNFGATY